MTKEEFAVVLIETLTCCGLEATKEQYAIWYERLKHIPVKAFKQACVWYERQRGTKFINSFYSTIRPKCLEFSGDWTDIVPGAIQSRPTQAKIDAHNRRMEACGKNPGDSKPVRKIGYVPKGTKSPAVTRSETEQISKLKEMVNKNE